MSVHDFDIARHERGGSARAFKIAGTEFRFKPSVGAELLADYYDTLNTPIEDPAFNRKVIAAADQLIVGWLEPGQDDTWAHVRRNDSPDPLTIRDLQDVIAHMTGVMTGRDREQPSGSSSTPSQPGTSSTATSPSTAAA